MVVGFRILVRLAAAAGLAGLLAACAPRLPNLEGTEYLSSWGVGAIDAQEAYRAGYTGKGVTIALVDCGLQGAQRELRRNVSRESVDLFAGQRKQASTDRHANYVATPLGAALDGKGLLGVAYNARLLAIRADMDGGYQGKCAFYSPDLARALDYAVAHRARIVVLPVQARKPMGEAFEASLKRVVESGAVVVIAAGNETGAQPSYPARYAVDPRYAGAIVVAGAAGRNGMPSAWSNKAGVVKDYFVSAPGDDVITDCGKRYCAKVSGTSFAAPYVAGALALVMQAHPDMNGQDVVRQVLNSARDVGEPGVDAVSGHGVLNVGKLFRVAQPALGGGAS